MRGGAMTTLEIVYASLGGVGTISGWVAWWIGRGDKKKVEAELRSSRRRSSTECPYIRVSSETFNTLMFPAQGFSRPYVICGDPSILCFARDEVEKSLPASTTVRLIVENKGCAAPEVELTLDGAEITLQPVEIPDAMTLYAISYPYVPEKHGTQQTIELSFLSETGIRDTHKYATNHGKRILTRIDPK
jgi:hypothetical protein